MPSRLSRTWFALIDSIFSFNPPERNLITPPNHPPLPRLPPSLTRLSSSPLFLLTHIHPSSPACPVPHEQHPLHFLSLLRIIDQKSSGRHNTLQSRDDPFEAGFGPFFLCETREAEIGFAATM